MDAAQQVAIAYRFFAIIVWSLSRQQHFLWDGGLAEEEVAPDPRRASVVMVIVVVVVVGAIPLGLLRVIPLLLANGIVALQLGAGGGDREHRDDLFQCRGSTRGAAGIGRPCANQELKSA